MFLVWTKTFSADRMGAVLSPPSATGGVFYWKQEVSHVRKVLSPERKPHRCKDRDHGWYHYLHDHGLHLAVNPNILSAAGMDSKAVLIATALASFIATALMAVLANYPFALAPGMGLNAYFAYTVVLTMGYSWQLALMAVLLRASSSLHCP